MQRTSPAQHSADRSEVLAGRPAHDIPRTRGSAPCVAIATSPADSERDAELDSSLASPAPSPIASAAFSHAHALQAANDLTGAARAFADLCLAYPERVDAYKAFGYVLCQLGDYQCAVAPLMSAVARDYGDPECLYFAAVCMQRTGDAQTARDMALDALEMSRVSSGHGDLHTKLTRLIDSL